MACELCVHRYDGPAGPECRRNPQQVVAVDWNGSACGKLLAEASPAERADRRNWDIVAAFPPANAGCGDFVHQM